MTFDLNDLNGPQRKIVRDVLLAAFNENELRRLLEDELNKNLDHLVESANLETKMFELISLSNRRQWTDQLIGAAQRVSGNARVAKLPETLAATEVMGLKEVDAQVATFARAQAEGGLERMVRKEGFADWGLWVERMAEIGRCICSIQYPNGVKLGGGTGFLVAEDLVLTNYHVIEDHFKKSLDATQIECQFDFAVGSPNATMVKLHAQWLVDHSVYSSHDPGDKRGLPDPDQLDYALLRLQRPVAGDVAGAKKRGSLPLSESTSLSSADDLLFIGQHPGLQPLKLGVGEVLAPNGNATRIRYDANTERGSSGSPCLDMQLNVVALHHAGDPDYTKLLGEYNQGIPIGLILKRMAARGVQKFWT